MMGGTSMTSGRESSAWRCGPSASALITSVTHLSLSVPSSSWPGQAARLALYSCRAFSLRCAAVSVAIATSCGAIGTCECPL